MKDILVAGASGHAAVVIDILEQQGGFRIAGLLARSGRGTCLGYNVLGAVEDLPRILAGRGIAAGIVAVGDNWTRGRVVEELLRLAPDFEFVTAIHPSARIGREAGVGAGSVVMAGAVINPRARVGRFSIVNTAATLDHDSVMEDYSSLAPRASTGGNVRLGAYAAVSLGAAVVHGITIGEHTVVGAGATVLRDLPPRVVAYGTPARIVRPRQPGDPYLKATGVNRV
jgi:sugar O-acyltransferase (sialic acid O-acetyltransferase NeuD family)